MAIIEMRSRELPNENTGSSSFPMSQWRGQLERRRPLGPRNFVHARSDDGLLTWSYTIGLAEAYGHPEFLLTGLDNFLAHSILAKLTERVMRGTIFTDATLEKNLLHRLICAFREVPASVTATLMPAANGQKSGTVRALQCVYPDNHNRLPWEAGYNASWHEVQPLFAAGFAMSKVELNLLQAAGEKKSRHADDYSCSTDSFPTQDRPRC